MSYDEYINKLKKSYIFRMRMIKRCIKHNAQKAAQKYRDALVTKDGLFFRINKKEYCMEVYK